MNSATLRSAVGGPNALSVWSLVVFIPLGLLSGTLWGLRNGLPLGPWLAAMALLQAALLLPFWLCRAILLRANRKGPRPVIGVAMFAFLGGLRAVLVVYTGAAMGVELPTGSVVDFIPNGVGIGVAILGIVAIVVDGSRRHRAVTQNLMDLDAEFERVRAFDEAELAGLEARVIDEVTGLLEGELRTLQSTAEQEPELAAARLRDLAATIVRPLSHEIADRDAWAASGDPIGAKPPRWQRAKAVIGDMRPANPLVPFLLVELIALPTAISERVGGVAFAAFVMLLGGAVILSLSWLLARTWPAGRTTLSRLIALVLAYVVIGTAAAWVMMTVTKIFAGVDNPIWIAPFYLTAIAIGLSVFTAISVQQRATEDRLAHAVARNAQLNAHVRLRSQQAQRRIAKLLHANVQAELTAAAWALAQTPGSSATEGGAQQIERLVTSIRTALQVQEQPIGPAREHILELVSLWSGALAVDVTVPDDVWPVLAEDPDALERVSDVICEALTNAVRHGRDSTAALTMAVDGEAIGVRVASNGSLSPGARPGLGSRFLAESAQTWSLTELDGQVCLTASIRRSVPA